MGMGSVQHRDSEIEHSFVDLIRMGDSAAIDRLGQLIKQRLRASFRGRSDVDEADLDDFTQDSCVRVIERVDQFRGESKFETWVTTIAIRVALEAMRRRSWSSERTNRVIDDIRASKFDEELRRDEQEMIGVLRSLIDSELSERQRVVICAELAGVPQIRIAESMGATRGAVYKVSHDARKKLKAALISKGYGDAFDLERDDGEVQPKVEGGLEDGDQENCQS